ncbi:hypothetical protein LSAT2_021265, partial [Lamellibrachia satsuma]
MTSGGVKHGTQPQSGLLGRDHEGFGETEPTKSSHIKSPRHSSDRELTEYLLDLSVTEIPLPTLPASNS